MGLAASQCRLLLLTARLSDTEYRAQMISQRRMALAMQTEQIATDYSRALNNRVLKHVFDLDGNNNATLKEALSYASLTDVNSFMGGGRFRVLDVDGRIAVTSADEIPGVILSQDAEGNQVYNQVSDKQIKEFCLAQMGSNPTIKEFAGKNWDATIVATAWKLIQSDATLAAAFKKTYASTGAQPVKNGSVIVGNDGNEYIVLPALNNTEYFQNCIRTGTVQVQQYQESFSENDGWANFNPLSSQFISDDLDTSDDAAAQAEYESKSAMIQAQDKMLEIELKQVETQHQAAQTEYDSVKKVIDKNIERSFKTFG